MHSITAYSPSSIILQSGPIPKTPDLNIYAATNQMAKAEIEF